MFTMNKKKIRSAIHGSVLVSALALFAAACNNNKTDYGSYDTGSSASAKMPSDPRFTNVPVDTNALTKQAPVIDNAANETMMAENKTVTPSTSTTMKKKVRATAGMPTVSKAPKQQVNTPGVSETASSQPSYPGGQSAAEQFINNNIQYPQTALDYNKEGTVQVQFIVDEHGNISGAHEVGTKLGEGLDDEAVRVVASMPSWSPATINGKPVSSEVTLPITFKIEE